MNFTAEEFRWLMEWFFICLIMFIAACVAIYKWATEKPNQEDQYEMVGVIRIIDNEPVVSWYVDRQELRVGQKLYSRSD